MENQDKVLDYAYAKNQYELEKNAGHLLTSSLWLLVMRETKEDKADGNN